MSEPIMRIAVIFCCMGMGVWPLLQRCGCCCTTAVQFADRFEEEQRCEHCCPTTPESDSECLCPLATRTFEAVPSFAIKQFAEDHSLVEAIFSSPFQLSKPGDSSLWEVVENLRPPRVPRHVMFCTYLE